MIGIKSDTFLTVIDEDEENPRVNLLINVQASSVDSHPPPLCPLTDTSQAKCPG